MLIGELLVISHQYAHNNPPEVLQKLRRSLEVVSLRPAVPGIMNHGTYTRWTIHGMLLISGGDEHDLSVVQWFDSAGFGTSTLGDLIIAAILIVALRRNRGAFKRCVYASAAYITSCVYTSV